MSNYSIVIDTSNFKPFDINIPLSVLRDYRDAYYRREDALQKIAEDIGEAQIPAPREGDREQQRIYDQYMQYQDDLKAASDDFSRGMNWKNASLISAINKRYGTEVKPIKQAVADFKTWRQNLDNIYKGDSSAIIGNEGVTAYDFLNGNMPDLKYRSGKDLRQVGEILGKAWFAAHPGKSEIVKGIFDGYVEYIQRGGDPKDAEALANAKYEAATGENPEGIQILINQVRDYVNDDMRDFSDDAKVKGFKELITGVAGAMPETRKDLKQDPNFVSDFEKRKQAFYEKMSLAENARKEKELLLAQQAEARQQRESRERIASYRAERVQAGNSKRQQNEKNIAKNYYWSHVNDSNTEQIDGYTFVPSPNGAYYYDKEGNYYSKNEITYYKDNGGFSSKSSTSDKGLFGTAKYSDGRTYNIYYAGKSNNQWDTGSGALYNLVDPTTNEVIEYDKSIGEIARKAHIYKNKNNNTASQTGGTQSGQNNNNNGDTGGLD